MLSYYYIEVNIINNVKKIYSFIKVEYYIINNSKKNKNGDKK